MTATNMLVDYDARIHQALAYCLKQTNLPLPNKLTGKVRDIYSLGEQMLIISCDRQSAFDRVLAHVPFKGQVLNLVSTWWFKKTAHLVPNHLISIPDPNVMLVKKCQVFPIEVIVRGYITGTTNTSLWTHYARGERRYCGIDLADGLQKNQARPKKHCMIDPFLLPKLLAKA
jgi:phosphoribosylaminoimidazole-succinocarboxamide synthase